MVEEEEEGEEEEVEEEEAMWRAISVSPHGAQGAKLHV